MATPNLFLGRFATTALAEAFVTARDPWRSGPDLYGCSFYDTGYGLLRLHDGVAWRAIPDFDSYVLMNAEEYDVLETNLRKTHINLYGAGTAVINLPEDAPAGWAVTIIQGQAQELRLTPPTGHAFLGSTEDFYLLLDGTASRPLAVEVVKIHGDNWAVIDFFDPAIATNFSFVDPNPV